MKKHIINFRVRYAETDQMGVVYYSNYLVWFEMARTEFFRSLGLDYAKMEKEKNIFLPVVESYCRYRSPLKYDDMVAVEVWIKEMGSSRLTFEYEVKRGAEAVTTGYTKHAFIDKNRKPLPIPDDVRELLEDPSIST